MTPLNPDFDLEYDDVDFILDEMKDSGEWAAMELREEQEWLESGNA